MNVRGRSQSLLVYRAAAMSNKLGSSHLLEVYVCGIRRRNNKAEKRTLESARAKLFSWVGLFCAALEESRFLP